MMCVHSASSEAARNPFQFDGFVLYCGTMLRPTAMLIVRVHSHATINNINGNLTRGSECELRICRSQHASEDNINRRNFNVAVYYSHFPPPSCRSRRCRRQPASELHAPNENAQTRARSHTTPSPHPSRFARYYLVINTPIIKPLILWRCVRACARISCAISSVRFARAMLLTHSPPAGPARLSSVRAPANATATCTKRPGLRLRCICVVIAG